MSAWMRVLGLWAALTLGACGGGGDDKSPPTPAPINTPPVAQAGSNQSVLVGGIVILDASSSTDADRDTLTFRWILDQRPEGSTAVLVGSDTARPSFTPDVAGTYRATLTVTDGRGGSHSASVIITAASANAAPVAQAGTAQNVVVGSLVTLDGSASSDANGDPLSYAWTLIEKPSASTAALEGADSARPRFTADLPGAYMARLVVSDGRLNSEAATVTVVAAAANVAPVARAGEAQNVTTGSVVALSGAGSSDANGDALTYLWVLSSRPTGSAAALDDTASVTPRFTADRAGLYVAALVVSDGRLSSAPVTVTVTAADANLAPVARAGADQSVTTGSVVTLDGSTSSDANNDPLTYVWSFVSTPAGSAARLIDATTARPSFSVDLAGTYVARLTVSDGLASASATVTVSASPANVAPVANAGPAQIVSTGTLVTLDGSASSDANGDTLTYAWTLTGRPAGSAAALTGADSARPHFTADVAGSYVATLTVSDGRLSASATVTVNAAPANVAPVADAGPDQSVLAGSAVTLDGGGSRDANGDTLRFAWTLVGRPARSAAALSADTTVRPGLVTDLPGTYVASLVVSDGRLSSVADTVTITASAVNTVPVADAGPDQNVTLGSVVQLDGTRSSDGDGDALVYRWTLTGVPTGSAAALDDATVMQPRFTADLAGTYVATLVVNDGQRDSPADTVTITVARGNSAPVARITAVTQAVQGDRVTFRATGSTDADGDPLTYRWTLLFKPAGSLATLSSTSGPEVSMVLDRTSAFGAGPYVVTLVVNDGQVDSDTVDAAVTATDFLQARPRYEPETLVNVGPRSVAIQPDGKVVVTGNNQMQTPVVRLLADASLDPTFAGGVMGVYDTVPPSDADAIGYEYAQSVVVQPDGKLLVMTSDQFSPVLLRLLPDGQRDIGFGSNGVVPLPRLRMANVDHGLTVRGDGGIYVLATADVGTSSVPASNLGMAVIARLRADGSFDPSFGAEGVARIQMISDAVGSAAASALSLQPDGSLMVAGSVWGLSAPTNGGATRHSDGFLLRLRTDGSLDTTFGSAGRVTFGIDDGLSQTPTSVTVLSSGQVLVSFLNGSSTDVTGELGVRRWSAAGAPDPAFDQAARRVLPRFSAYGFAPYASLEQRDGRIVVSGYGDLPEETTLRKSGLVLIRLLADGQPDTSFSNDGVAIVLDTSDPGNVAAPTAGYGGRDGARGLGQQADGKLIVTGFYSGSGSWPMEVFRLNNDGSLDLTYRPDYTVQGLKPRTLPLKPAGARGAKPAAPRALKHQVPSGPVRR